MKIHANHNHFLFLIFISITSFSQKPMSFLEKKIPEPKNVDSIVFNFQIKQPGYKNLTNEEKKFYYWVNYSRNNPRRFYDSVVIPIVKIYPELEGDNLLSLKRDLFNIYNLPFLKLNTQLIMMAKSHSNDITSHNSVPSHNSTNGDSFIERFKKFNLKTCGGENICNGINEPLFLMVLLYLDIDLPELGHRKALLNPGFVETGIGESFYKNGNIFIVEDFACLQN